MSKIPEIKPAHVDKSTLLRVVSQLVGKQIKIKGALSGTQISQAQALAVTSSTDFTWEHFAEILGDKYAEVKKTFGNSITSAREALGKLLTSRFKNEFTGDARTVEVSSDQNKAKLPLNLPKVVVKKIYEHKGLKIVPLGKDGQDLEVLVDRQKVSSTEKERTVQIDIERNGKPEKLTVTVQFVKAKETADASAQPGNPAAKPTHPAAKTQTLLDHGKSAEIVFEKDKTQSIQLPEGVLLADSVIEGEVRGSYTVGKVDPTRTKFELKANGEPKTETLKIPTKKGAETGEYTLKAKPPANGTGSGEQTWWAKGWGVALTAGIAALVWIGALATKAEKTGSDILMGIVAVVAGGAIGGKWLGSFFGGDAKPST